VTAGRGVLDESGEVSVMTESMHASGLTA